MSHPGIHIREQPFPSHVHQLQVVFTVNQQDGICCCVQDRIHPLFFLFHRFEQPDALRSGFDLHSQGFKHHSVAFLERAGPVSVHRDHASDLQPLNDRDRCNGLNRWFPVAFPDRFPLFQWPRKLNWLLGDQCLVGSEHHQGGTRRAFFSGNILEYQFFVLQDPQSNGRVSQSLAYQFWQLLM